LIIKSSKNGNIAFSDAYYPLEIQAGFLYSFGLIINRETNTANILVYNLMNEENDINNKGLKINNFIYSLVTINLIVYIFFNPSQNSDQLICIISHYEV